jgi:hypothetical protein
MIYFSFDYLLFIAPAILLALWAQWRVHATYARAQQMPASMSGARAAWEILSAAGLHHVRIEQVGGFLSDHYDPRDKVLRLSPQVYNSSSLAAVGIAAHEAGHALQDAHGYVPLAIRNAAVPAANFGSGFSFLLIILGAILSFPTLLWLGIAAFGCVVFFQLVNLPVEFNASSRARRLLAQLNIVSDQQMGYVNGVLNAAAWTYVAATLQSILTLLYYVLRFGSNNRD